MTNEQGAKYLFKKKMYDEGYHDIKIFGSIISICGNFYLENSGHF